MKPILLIILLSFYSEFADACKCDYSLKKDIKESNYILVIKVLENLDDPTNIILINRSRVELGSALLVSGFRVKVEVLKYYKGNLESDTIIIEGQRGYSCAQEFFIGKTYLAFLDGDESLTRFYTSNCNHNIKLNETEEFKPKVKSYFKKS